LSFDLKDSSGICIVFNSVSAHLSGGSLVRGFGVHLSGGSLIWGFTCPEVHLSVLFVYYNFRVQVSHSNGPPLPGCAIRFDIRTFRPRTHFPNSNTYSTSCKWK